MRRSASMSELIQRKYEYLDDRSWPILNFRH